MSGSALVAFALSTFFHGKSVVGTALSTQNPRILVVIGIPLPLRGIGISEFADYPSRILFFRRTIAQPQPSPFCWISLPVLCRQGPRPPSPDHGRPNPQRDRVSRERCLARTRQRHP